MTRNRTMPRGTLAYGLAGILLLAGGGCDGGGPAGPGGGDEGGGDEGGGDEDVGPSDGGGGADAVDAAGPDGDAGETVAAAPCADKEFGEACDDGNPCTTDEKCIDGECRGEVKSCDDGDPCTEGSCEPEDGGCVQEPASGGSCDDGNPCTTDETCEDGTCVGEPLSDVACDDGTPCTTGDVCDNGECTGEQRTCNDFEPCTQDLCDPSHEQADPETGCVHLPVDDGTSCDDTNPCTEDDHCEDGVCTGTATPGAPCNDGDLCTVDDACREDGSCQGSEPRACDDGNPCTTDECLPDEGCTFEPDVGAACDDGDLCTVDDACTEEATCIGDPKCVTDSACTEGSCDPATGNCSVEEISCDDGSPCTADSCDPEAGCINEPIEASCDDGDPCTVDDTCSGGECVGTPKDCGSTDNPCTDRSCNTETGACEEQPLNGKACDDGDLCTEGDTCSGGECLGTPKTCGDADPCTDDFCDPEIGECIHEEYEECGNLALERTNEYRALVDLPLVSVHSAIAEAAQAHCDYYVDHADEVYSGPEAISPHQELPDYDGYTGQGFAERLEAAGYPNQPLSEVMSFVNDPVQAVDGWMATVYHRIPFVLAAADEIGYGHAQDGESACDTMDFGTLGEPKPEYEDAIIPFPPDAMTGVPTSWDGLESPQPPAPPDGYPSGPVLTVTFGAGQGSSAVSLDAHELHGPNGPVPHQALTPQNDPNLQGEPLVALYAHEPLESTTTYTVTLEYSKNGVPGSFEWSFTTGSGMGQHYLE